MLNFNLLPPQWQPSLLPCPIEIDADRYPGASAPLAPVEHCRPQTAGSIYISTLSPHALTPGEGAALIGQGGRHIPAKVLACPSAKEAILALPYSDIPTLPQFVAAYPAVPSVRVRYYVEKEGKWRALLLQMAGLNTSGHWHADAASGLHHFISRPAPEAPGTEWHRAEAHFICYCPEAILLGEDQTRLLPALIECEWAELWQNAEWNAAPDPMAGWNQSIGAGELVWAPAAQGIKISLPDSETFTSTVISQDFAFSESGLYRLVWSFGDIADAVACCEELYIQFVIIGEQENEWPAGSYPIASAPREFTFDFGNRTPQSAGIRITGRAAHCEGIEVSLQHLQLYNIAGCLSRFYLNYGARRYSDGYAASAPALAGYVLDDFFPGAWLSYRPAQEDMPLSAGRQVYISVLIADNALPDALRWTLSYAPPGAALSTMIMWLPLQTPLPGRYEMDAGMDMLIYMAEDAGYVLPDPASWRQWKLAFTAGQSPLSVEYSFRAEAAACGSEQPMLAWVNPLGAMEYWPLAGVEAVRSESAEATTLQLAGAGSYPPRSRHFRPMPLAERRTFSVFTAPLSATWQAFLATEIAGAAALWLKCGEPAAGAWLPVALSSAISGAYLQAVRPAVLRFELIMEESV